MRVIANKPTASRRSAAFAALLALCLLFSQAIGFTHAYAHANLAADASSAQAKHKLFDHAKSASGCAAFDAIALGAGVHSADFSLPASDVAGDAKVLTSHSPQRLRFIAHFSPRAPPPQA